MKQLEILAADGIFVVLAQESQVVSIVEIFKPGWVATEFLIVGADGTRVLHSAVDHFLLAVPPDLKRNCRKRHCGHYGHQTYDQEHRDQDIALFVPAQPVG